MGVKKWKQKRVNAILLIKKDTLRELTEFLFNLL